MKKLFIVLFLFLTTTVHAAQLNIGDLTVTGQIGLFSDSKKLLLGGASDLEIYHDGTDSNIVNNTGILDINSTSGIRLDDYASIGVAPVATQKMTIQGNFTATATNAALRLQPVSSPASSAANEIIGAYFFVQIGNANWAASSQALGSYPLVVGSDGTGSSDLDVIGTNSGGFLQYGGTGTYKDIYGAKIIPSSLAFSGTAIADNMYGVYITNAAVGTGTFTIPNHYGLYIEEVTQGSAINNEIFLVNRGQITFRDQQVNIKSGADGHLDLNADVSVDINSDLQSGGDFSFFYGNSQGGDDWIRENYDYNTSVLRWDGSSDGTAWDTPLMSMAYTGGITLETSVLAEDKIKFTQSDGAEFIDSQGDGYLDLGAGTAIRTEAVVIAEDAIYFTQTDGAEKIDSASDGTLDLYAGTSIELHDATNIGDGTNEAMFAADGELTLAGTAKVIKSKTYTFNYATVRANGKPTQVTRGVFQGFSLPVYNNDDEELFACQCIPADWDGSTDPVVYIAGWLDTANTDKNFNLQVSVEYYDPVAHDVVPTTTNDYPVETDTGTAAQYASFLVGFTLDASAINVSAKQPLGIRIRRIAASEDEITGEFVVEGMVIYYTSNKLGEAT